MEKRNVSIRKAGVKDAKGVADVINSVVDEDKYTIMRRQSEEEEKSFIGSLSEREAVFFANVDGKVVGAQTLSLRSGYSDKTAHVATMGTWVIDGYRGIGVGKRLAQESLDFARGHDYEKIVIEVLADNSPALKFYSGLGFEQAGLLKGVVKLHGEYKDEVIMEFFL